MMTTKLFRTIAAACFTLGAGRLACAFTVNQSALDSAGIQASRLESLWWMFLWICVAVYVIVMAVLVAAIFKKRRATADTPPEVKPDRARETRAANIVKGAVAVTTVTLFVLMITSFRTGTAINQLAEAAEDPLIIRVTGNQWWWDIRYMDAKPSNDIETANEIHLPVGRPVKLELNSTDVIHSFWLPNIDGKKDLVPNYPTNFYFRPDKIGTYDGQCAEFCGYQHAKMRFKVVVESPEDFAKWYAASLKTPPPPTAPLEQRGQQIFLTSTCTQCHAVMGTPASAHFGPDLTHIASRPYIAAGTLQNTDENLKAWITDPQKIKPGNRMPMNTFSDDDLNALVAYLRSLK